MRSMRSSTIRNALAVVLSLQFSSILWTVEIALAASGDFVNWRGAPYVGGPYEDLFKPQNDGMEGQNIQDIEFRSGFEMLQNIVTKAQTDGKRIRMYGSKWSDVDVAYTKEYLVESWGLNYCKVGLTDDARYVDRAYQPIADRLVFAQSGVFIKYLNEVLLNAGLALPTTGSGDGQRVVGAIATESHGSAYTFGPMTNWVRGIHVVLPGNDHVFIQRSSDKVVTSDFVDYLGSGGRLVESDDMFNAALVSFGSFGAIHGLVIEAEPLYELKCQKYLRPYSDIEPMLNTNDISSLNLEGFSSTASGYHITFVVNPFRLDDPTAGVSIDYCEKIELPPMDSSSLRQRNGEPASLFGEDFDLDTFINGIPDSLLFGLGAAIKRLYFSGNVQSRIDIVQPFPAPKTQYPSEWFTFPTSTSPRKPAGSISANIGVAVPLSRTTEALQVMTEALTNHPIQTGYQIRPVKNSDATLGFIRFPEVSQVISLNSVHHVNTFNAHEQIFAALEKSGIPHAYHWGKNHPMTNGKLAALYGSAWTDFQAQRNTLLDTESLRDMFANEWMEEIGLYTPAPLLVSPNGG